jgi:hypothetical protein
MVVVYFKVIGRHFSGPADKKHVIQQWRSQFSNRNSNFGSLEYEVETLATACNFQLWA